MLELISTVRGVDPIMRRFASFVGLALILSLPTVPVLAQSGFVLFGGEKDPENTLEYTMTNNRSKARVNLLDLRMKQRNVAIAEIRLDYPYFFDRSFDTNSIEVLDDNTKASMPVEKIEQDTEDRTITIVMKRAIPAETPLRIRMLNFTNPRTPGLFKIQVRYLGTEPNPLYRYAGTWYLSFN